MLLKQTFLKPNIGKYQVVNNHFGGSLKVTSRGMNLTSRNYLLSSQLKIIFYKLCGKISQNSGQKPGLKLIR